MEGEGESAPAAVAAPAVEAAPENQSEGGQKKGQLKVLSQNMNVHHLVSHSKDHEDRIDKFVKDIGSGGYDVVCIQELFVLRTLGKTWGAEQRARLLQKSKEVGFPHSMVSKAGNAFFGQDAGLIILSKFPIENSFNVAFKAYGWKETPNKKGFVHVVISQPEGEPLHVVTTHLDAHEPKSRESQIKHIRQHLQGHTSTNSQVVVAGNFNVAAESPEFKVLKNMLHPLKDGWVLGGSPPPATVPSGACVDYCFLSLNLKFRGQVALDLGVSDHFAVITEFDRADQ